MIERSCLRLLVAALLPCLAWAAPGGCESPPWEIWTDLHRLAELTPEDQVLLHSSHCPDGCRYDRHSAGDWRYLRVDGAEGVIFEQAGAGAITRIWMTMGAGSSQPLDPAITLRVYVDGDATPVVELPLPDLFSGDVAPFVQPLVGDRLVSSGGNFSYVPIPYREGCRVTLEGADTARIWFQFTYHRLAEAGDLVSFDPATDLSAWAMLLDAAGSDPWPVVDDLSAATWSAGEVMLSAGASAVVAELAGQDSLTALRLDLAEASWPKVEIRLTFDGEETVRMPLSDFFAIGRGGVLGTRSLLFGVSDDGMLYGYAPMPFFQSATVQLVDLRDTGPPLAVSYELRRAGRPPAPSSGRFGAQLRQVDGTPPNLDLPLLELAGTGRWLGLFADLSTTEPNERQYLEGDERVYLDGSPHPQVYGTGTEDIFNGGFYFDQGTFRRALHGATYHFVDADGTDVTAAYRLMPTDGVAFAHSLLAGLEGGPTGQLPLRARTVSWYYHRPEPALRLWDVLDLGDPTSRARHEYAVSGAHETLPLESLFEGSPALALTATGVYRPPGLSTFRLRAAPDAERFRLRRRLDAGVAGQQAQIWVAGEEVARFPPVGVNAARRWLEVDITLPSAVRAEDGQLEIGILSEEDPGAVAGSSRFTAFRYELWSDADPLLFADGFESGGAAAWSATR